MYRMECMISIGKQPSMLAYFRVWDVLVDMTFENNDSLSRMDSLNVWPCHRPIFWISLSEYPLSWRDISPSALSEWVLIVLISMPLIDG